MAEHRKETNTIATEIQQIEHQLSDIAKRLRNIPIIYAEDTLALPTTKKRDAILYGFHVIQRLLRQRTLEYQIEYIGMDEDDWLYVITYNPSSKLYIVYLSLDLKSLDSIEMQSKEKVKEKDATVYYLLDDLHFTEQSFEIHIPTDPTKESIVVWNKGFKNATELRKKIYSLLL